MSLPSWKLSTSNQLHFIQSNIYTHIWTEAKKNEKQGNGAVFIFWLHLKDVRIIGWKMERLVSPCFQVQRDKLIFFNTVFSVVAKSSVCLINLDKNNTIFTDRIVSEIPGYTHQYKEGSCAAGCQMCLKLLPTGGVFPWWVIIGTDNLAKVELKSGFSTIMRNTLN